MTCAIFGNGMPALIPITFLTIVLNFLYEKKMLARQCRLPPNYDPHTNKYLTSSFLYAPIIYSAIGFWMYSNVQLQNNVVTPKHTIHSVEHCKHNIIDSVTNISPATPYLILLVISILAKIDYHYNLFDKVVNAKIQKKLVELKAKNQQDIPKFCQAVSYEDKKLLLHMEASF